MKRMLWAGLAAMVALPLMAQDPKDGKKDDCCETGCASAAAKHPQFARLKELVGTWESSKSDSPATITYRLTAGGTALVETLMPGTEHEMLTIYTVEGEDLVLTHYCLLGNAPRMKAEKESKDGVLRFSCTTGGAVKCDTESHMHSAAITIKDKDTLSATWTQRVKGKVQDVGQFDLVRKK